MENNSGWLKSKKGGLYRQTKLGTTAIFKNKTNGKWKISHHHPHTGLTFHPDNFESQDQALLYIEKNVPVIND
jgi:ketosteroid isomerase-like protein